MRHLAAAAILALAPAFAGAAETTEAYDTLFRTGTLDDIRRDATLVYGREVESAGAEGTGAEDGTIELSFATEGEGPETATLMLYRDGQHRNLGSFPAGVGNPMIMYFYESVVRDMAVASGGSPFYIRNRVKEALTREVPVEAGTATFEGAEIDVSRVTLHPFADDPNAGRMEGFDDLALTVTMSEAVPGWYLSLEAIAPGPEAPLYRSTTRFRDVEEER